LIPRENERDLKEVPQRVRSKLDIELVNHVDEVIIQALIVKEGEELFKEVSIESIFNDVSLSAHNTPAQ
jgi:ATP-dependent Lon protease